MVEQDAIDLTAMTPFPADKLVLGAICGAAMRMGSTSDVSEPMMKLITVYNEI